MTTGLLKDNSSLAKAAATPPSTDFFARITEDAACVSEARREGTVYFVGDEGSGKTTLLNAFLQSQRVRRLVAFRD